MKADDFLRRVRRLATRRGWEIDVSEGRNHTKLRLNGRRTVVPRHGGDLKPGTLRAILKQSGIQAGDLKE